MSFHIKKVTVTGKNKVPATITFNNGLNIICGVSDSGKTCVLKCIQFAMGIVKVPFSTEETGYDKVRLDIMTEGGVIQLSRVIKKNTVNVVSNVDFIDSGDYDTNYTSKGNKNPVLNELWLRLIGIETLPMVIKNQEFKRQRLTWKTVIGLLWLEEEEIQNSKSVLLPSVPTQNTYFYSSLLYLLTGNEFPNIEEKDKEEISKAKKEAVRLFVNNRIICMNEKKDEINKKLSNYTKFEIEIETQKLIDNLSKTEDEIVAATKESKDLLSTLLTLKEKEAENQITLSHFKALKTQYLADVKRLSFIVDGEVQLQSIDKNKVCPFCEGSIKNKDRESYIEGSRAELNRIMIQLQGLSECQIDVENYLKETNDEICSLELQKSNIENLIEKELIPQANALKEGIENYHSYTKLEKELSVIDQISSEWIDELYKEETSDIDKTKFKPKEYFPIDFNRRIDEIAHSILVECKYENLNITHFNIGTFDLEINAKKKETSHGKGYWAFINTVVGLTFRKYLQMQAIHKPSFFIVDTPLLGLDQGINDNAPDSSRAALFQYFIEHQSEGQIIVVENTKDLPDLEYELNGAKVIEFNHDKYESKYKESRYGFLHDVYAK